MVISRAYSTHLRVGGRSPDLSALRLLVAVERHGSLARGAAGLGLSQPAASKKMAQLERQLGLSLVIRTSRGSTLTQEGVVVAGRSRQILESVEQLMGIAASMRAASQSVLRIAASMTIAEHLMPIWLSHLSAQNPDVHAVMRMANSLQVQKMVMDGGADIGFVESPTIDARLRSLRVGRDRLVVVVPRGHHWALRGRPIQAEELRRTPFVTREEGSGTRETLARALGEEGVEPLLELGSLSAVKGAVLAGGGAAALSILAVTAELGSGELIEVPVEEVTLDRDLTAVWLTTESLSVWSRELIHRARNDARSGAGGL